MMKNTPPKELTQYSIKETMPGGHLVTNNDYCYDDTDNRNYNTC